MLVLKIETFRAFKTKCLRKELWNEKVHFEVYFVGIPAFISKTEIWVQTWLISAHTKTNGNECIQRQYIHSALTETAGTTSIATVSALEMRGGTIATGCISGDALWQKVWHSSLGPQKMFPIEASIDPWKVLFDSKIPFQNIICSFQYIQQKWPKSDLKTIKLEFSGI